MQEQMQTSLVEQIFQRLETKLADTTWTETQDADFIKDLGMVTNVVRNLSTQVYIFMDIFGQYVSLVEGSLMFSSDTVGSDSDDSKVSPTQTPANRAERRAAKKSGLILPEDKKLVTP